MDGQSEVASLAQLVERLHGRFPTTAHASHPCRRRSWRRRPRGQKAHLSATAILIVLTSLMGTTAARADDSAAASISPAEQKAFEAELNGFLAAQPEPAVPESGASVAEKNAYATELGA